MRTTIAILLVIFCSLHLKAQIYYSFSATQGNYSSLTTATTAPLTAAFPSAKNLLDESFSNNIPIGFSFNYNGTNYNTIHLNSNGYVSLGAAFLASSTSNPMYEINELRNGVGLKGATRPLIAPFWDNLLLGSQADISYTTSGNTPNRIFTTQWKNMIWESGTPALSFQLKLFETSNIIEFIYQSESGLGGINKSASIGITSSTVRSSAYNSDSLSFLSVTSTGANATANKFIETDTINKKPESGQIFRFTPFACTPPSNIKLSGTSGISAILKWDQLSTNAVYEYAISNISIPPFAATSTTNNFIKLEGLTPNTQYYFYLRNACGSAWNMFNFKTTTTASLPYQEEFDQTIDIAIPETMTAQNNSNSFANIYWQTSALPVAASGTKVAVNSAPFVPAKTWIFTPAFNFIAGNTYTLSFKNATSGGLHAMEVKYGRYAGEDSMRYTISIDSNISNTVYLDKTFNFVPEFSGDYYIGFGYKAAVNNELFLLDAINLKSITVASGELVQFKATLINTKEVQLDWQTKNERNISHFLIERSADGINFKSIGRVNSLNNSATTNSYNYIDKTPNVGNNYYRIRQVNTSAGFVLSNIEVVKLTNIPAAELFPNPGSSQVFLKVDNATDATVKLFTTSGIEIPITNSIVNSNLFKIIPKQVLIRGIYLVHLISPTKTMVLKWIVL
ncbi:MAG: T9SS C-terminal target domain-containing protein [Sphingobacteriia bacterium]|nr:MAG: T9SS C-terminal target domain-containing protein [Sphingobacteriia bacterium]